MVTKRGDGVKMITAKEAKQEVLRYCDNDEQFKKYCSSIESEILEAARHGASHISFLLKNEDASYYAKYLSRILSENGFTVDTNMSHPVSVLLISW